MTSVAVPAVAGCSKPRRDLRGRWRWLFDHRAHLLAAIAVTAIVAGGLLHLWAAELTVEVARTAIAEGHLGVDEERAFDR